MLHLVFQHSDINILRKAIELDESLKGDIIQIKDDFAIGPLENIDTEEVWQARCNWWTELIKASPYPDDLAGSFDDRKTVQQLKEILDNDDKEEQKEHHRPLEPDRLEILVVHVDPGLGEFRRGEILLNLLLHPFRRVRVHGLHR